MCHYSGPSSVSWKPFDSRKAAQVNVGGWEKEELDPVLWPGDWQADWA